MSMKSPNNQSKVGVYVRNTSLRSKENFAAIQNIFTFKTKKGYKNQGNSYTFQFKQQQLDYPWLSKQNKTKFWTLSDKKP